MVSCATKSVLKMPSTTSYAEGPYKRRGARSILPGSRDPADWERFRFFPVRLLQLTFWIDCSRILQKHIKRQIISLTGSFQVIAGLGTYYVFIASLNVGFSSRLPINSLSQSAPQVAQLTSEFSHLKMLGHMYVVEDAWDLARS